jgi:hypothetical protein
MTNVSAEAHDLIVMCSMMNPPPLLGRRRYPLLRMFESGRLNVAPDCAGAKTRGELELLTRQTHLLFDELEGVDKGIATEVTLQM